MQRAFVVADHVEPAAPLGAFRSEGGDDHVSSGLHRALDLRDVPPAGFYVGEEMEYGAIVPNVVVRFGQICGGHVRRQPCHSSGPLAQAIASDGESLLREIEHRHLAMTAL